MLKNQNNSFPINKIHSDFSLLNKKNNQYRFLNENNEYSQNNNENSQKNKEYYQNSQEYYQNKKNYYQNNKHHSLSNKNKENYLINKNNDQYSYTNYNENFIENYENSLIKKNSKDFIYKNILNQTPDVIKGNLLENEMIYKSMLDAKSYYIPLNKQKKKIEEEKSEFVKNEINITPFEVRKDFNLGNTFKLSNLDNLIKNY